MNKREPCLMTKHHPDRSRPRIVPRFLWESLWLAMWSWAIVGPLCVTWAVVSRFVDLPDLLSFPKGEALWPFSNLGGLGITFVWLRLRGYIKSGGE
jgi:hypothetical protein